MNEEVYTHSEGKDKRRICFEWVPIGNGNHAANGTSSEILHYHCIKDCECSADHVKTKIVFTVVGY